MNKKKHINKRKEALSLAQVSSVDSEADSDDPEESLSKEELAEIQKQANQEAGLDQNGELLQSKPEEVQNLTGIAKSQNVSNEAIS